MASKMVTVREKSSLLVEATVTKFRATGVIGMTEFTIPYIHEGEPSVDVEHLLLVLQRALADHRQKMVAADQAHLDELDDDHDPRRRRDEATAELQSKMIRIRGVLENLYGPKGADELVGIEGRTSQDPATLLRQCQRFLDRVNDPELDLGPPLIPTFVFDPKALDDEVAPLCDELREALLEVTLERRDADLTQLAKNQAIEAFDRAFLAIASTLEAIFTLAGRDDLAQRVRPSRRRPGQVEDSPDDAGEAEGPEPGGEPAADAPTA